MGDTTEIKLKKFDPKSIEGCRTIVVIAKRNSGKSILVRDLLYHLRDRLPFGMAFSGTEQSNGFYGQMMPKSFIYDDFDAEATQKLIMRQKYMVQNKKKKPEAFLVVDDCMADSRIMMKDNGIRTIFFNGRHMRILFIMNFQYSLEISTSIRANIDYLFVLKENIISNQMKLHTHFFGMFPTFQMFQQTMNACTENFGVLCLDNTSRSNKIEDCVFHYKAALHGPFKICSPKVWKLHKKIYSDNDHKVSLQSIQSMQKTTVDKGRAASKNTSYSVIKNEKKDKEKPKPKPTAKPTVKPKKGEKTTFKIQKM